MKTSPLKYLATLLSCGAMLAGGQISAQTQTQSQTIEYSARPLPPLPTASTAEHFLNATTTQAQTVDSGTDGFNPGTLFTVEAPPVPPGYDVTARIVKTPTVESATQPTPPRVAQAKQNELTSSTFEVAVESQSKFAPPEYISPLQVPDSPEHLETPNAPVPKGYLVSFQKKGSAEDLEPVLNSPGSDIDDAQSPNTSESDNDSSDPDSLEDLEADDVDDDDRETDDLDQEEDGLQPEPRQFGVWPKKPMQEVRTDIREMGGVIPADESGVLTASSRRYYRSEPKTEKVFAWAAPKIRYQPLYFEDAQLERYGQTRGLVKQPFVSGFKFFRDAALLPLNAKIDRPGSCDGPLGFCRPGSPCSDCKCPSCQR